LHRWRFFQRVVSWSPVGHWIAFADEAGGAADAKPKERGPNAIYVISPQTLEPRQLTFPSPDDVGDSAPTFSPDGETLAFIITARLALQMKSGRFPFGVVKHKS
jgi:Tol biopolymer transport system component